MTNEIYNPVLAVDPGKTGAVAVVDKCPDGNVYPLYTHRFKRVPKVRFLGEAYVDAIWEAYECYQGAPADLVIEAMSDIGGQQNRQSSVSVNTTAGNWGITYATLMSLTGKAPAIVRATDWTRRMGLHKAGKEGNMAMARDLFPGLADNELKPKAADGLADALLIAYDHITTNY